MPVLWVILGAGTILAFGLYACRLRQRGLSPRLALWGFLLGGALALIGAKAGYLALMWNKYGFERAVSFSADRFSVVCGAMALCAGIALTGRMEKPRVRGLALLDAFAPCGALVLAAVRAWEYGQGLLGAGSTLSKTELWARIPFGIQNASGKWRFAVCTLEAALALAVAVIFLIRRGGRQNLPGWALEKTAVLLCLCQVFCESLRNVGMKWGAFVRVEQVMCAAIAAAFILRGCIKSRKDRPGWKRFLPMIVTLVCVGVMVCMEFALDKGLLWLTHRVVRIPAELDAPAVAHNTEVCYGIMILCLAVIFRMHGITVRRREQA